MKITKWQTGLLLAIVAFAFYGCGSNDGPSADPEEIEAFCGQFNEEAEKRECLKIKPSLAKINGCEKNRVLDSAKLECIRSRASGAKAAACGKAFKYNMENDLACLNSDKTAAEVEGCDEKHNWNFVARKRCVLVLEKKSTEQDN